ncbi:MAG: response regulator [Planctomycetota bacterium]
MGEAEALKILSKETKALIIVSEFEARRMPMFQMRAVLNAIISNEEEKKDIIDLVDRDLRATGYPSDKVGVFLNELIQLPAVVKPPEMSSLLGTRRLRSPFALGFEAAGPMADQDKLISKTAVYTMKPGSPAEVSASPPSSPISATKLPISPSEAPTRHKTFVFNEMGLPAEAASSGTKAWREQLFFGKTNPNLSPSSIEPSVPGVLSVRPLVLLADDDKRIRMVFRIRIEEIGLDVVEYDNGQEAWNRIQKGDITLVILDMKMPGLHGLEILSNMQDKQIHIPIVICSAYDQLQHEFIVKSHPRLRYLVKPVAPETLIAAIKDLLALKPHT